MSRICNDRPMNRRKLFELAGLSFVTRSTRFRAGPPTAATVQPTSVTAAEALANLKSGNDKYVKSPEVCSADLANRRASVATSQKPWATIVSCSDSRVPPELLFGGLGVGELFVARNAGNMVDTAT